MNARGTTTRPKYSTGAGETVPLFARSLLVTHHSPRRSGGFTFVELLAAMVFVAIVIPAAVHALTIANRAGVVAEHKRVAAQLADGLLNELGVTGDWRSGKQTGDFGKDRPGYRWAVHNEAWETGTMRLVSVEVFFDVQGREYSVRLSTLMEEASL